ncbi:MAG: T9SS type A sorting domain-containing protein [Bacteroidetes bacterium]|nr:T9SS type A sorting domain-containing protein [Bacteroidota bacterium]
MFKILISVLLVTGFVQAQMNKKVSVFVNSKVDEANKSITLYWPKFKDATQVTLYQKNFTSGNWEIKKTRSGADSGFFKIDNVNIGQLYEFQIAKMGTTSSYGYIYTGINIEEVHSEGNILMVIDSAIYTKIPKSIKQYETDLIASGWKTEKVVVSPKKTVTEIKEIIKGKTGITTVVLIGHVAVPYSGQYGFDGHPEHQGAWAADMYYGELDGTWTDNSVNANPSGARPETINVPGDGKFDQQWPPSDVDIEIARIDLTRLSSFGKTDSALHAYYFQKNHHFRSGGFNHEYKAIIDDNFTSYEMASWGFRSYAPAVDTGNLYYNIDNSSNDYVTTLKNKWWMLAAASGPGSYTSCGGVVNTSNFVNDSIKTVISGMSGSYFGDWDINNNLLRASLASKPSILSAFWGGIPAWVLHPLAMGYDMGYCAKISMNNKGTYVGNFNGGRNSIHISLLGDPTVNIYPVKSPTNLVISGTASAPKLTWTASADNNIIGYNIYRANTLNGDFVKANTAIVTGTTFTDTKPRNVKTVYIVRAVKKIINPSGIHNQMSLGAIDSAATTNLWVKEVETKGGVIIFPNPVKNSLNIEIQSMTKEPNSVEIYDIKGKMVCGIKTFNNNITLNTSDLAAGVYIVKVYNKHYLLNQKFIKE